MGGVHLQAQHLAGWGRKERFQTCLGCLARHLPRRIKATVIQILGQIIRFERLHVEEVSLQVSKYEQDGAASKGACCPVWSPGWDPRNPPSRRWNRLMQVAGWPLHVPMVRMGNLIYIHMNIWKKRRRKALDFKPKLWFTAWAAS